MTSLKRSTNITFGAITVVGVIAAIIFGKFEQSGLAAFAAEFVTFCVLIAWGIQLLIDRKVSKVPSRQLTPEEMQKHNTMRMLVALALLAMFIFAVTH